MVGVDVVTAPFGNILKLDTGVLVWPDVVVPVLGTLLDTSNLDGLRSFLSARSSTVSDVAGECLLHALLFLLLNVQKLVGHTFSVILDLSRLLQPLWEVSLDGCGHGGWLFHRHLPYTANEIHILSDVAKEGVCSVLGGGHGATTSDRCDRREAHVELKRRRIGRCRWALSAL